MLTVDDDLSSGGNYDQDRLRFPSRHASWRHSTRLQKISKAATRNVQSEQNTFSHIFSSLFIQVERDSKWSDCRREQVNSFHLIVHFCPTTLLHCWHTFVELVNTIIHSICSRAIVFVVNLPATNSPVDTSVAVSQWVKLRCQLLAKVNGSLTDADLQIAKSTTILTGRRKCR